MSRGNLSEVEWHLLKPLLPAERGRRSRPAFDNRRIVNGSLWRVRTGAPWRDLPEKYGKWMMAYQRFRRWSEAGIWEAVATTLAQAMADTTPSYLLADKGYDSDAIRAGLRPRAFAPASRPNPIAKPKFVGADASIANAIASSG